ncbi:MAG: TnpV protein [Clostridia bacterium]|nr:TnpV protein [Clostridia bacterium]MBR3917991.1 TnpV protein [Clostridia bacterium]
MNNKSSFEQNGGTYRMVGDYKIPNITLPAEANKSLGVWGLKRKDYLMKHSRVQFNIILMNGTLWTHLAEVDEQTSAMFSRLVEQLKVNEGITEQLKADNQMEWVARMNNIEARAREMVCNELIYK